MIQWTVKCKQLFLGQNIGSLYGVIQLAKRRCSNIPTEGVIFLPIREPLVRRGEKIMQQTLQQIFLLYHGTLTLSPFPLQDLNQQVKLWERQK